MPYFLVSIQHPGKLLKPSSEQALRPDFISFLGVLNNYIFLNFNRLLFVQNI